MSTAEEALAAFARVLAPMVAKEVARELRAGSDAMVSQHGSPLGNRRHAAAVRRRVQSGQGGAVIVGRRLLLTRDALAEELAALNRKTREPAPKEPTTDFAKKYGFERRSNATA